MPRITLQRLVMYTKSSYTSFIEGFLFAYSKKTGTRILISCFQTSICGESCYREKESENWCNSSGSKKSILVYVLKASENRQRFFFAFSFK